MNPRRPLFFLQLLLLSLLLVGAWACDRTNSGPPVVTEGSGSAEAEQTQEMEDKAADINQQAEDLKNMEGSDQDKIDAYNKLQEDQRSLAEQGEGGN